MLIEFRTANFLSLKIWLSLACLLQMIRHMKTITPFQSTIGIGAFLRVRLFMVPMVVARQISVLSN